MKAKSEMSDEADLLTSAEIYQFQDPFLHLSETLFRQVFYSIWRHKWKKS